jgi:hypothetical protein
VEGPITAEALRRRPEWLEPFPGASLAREEDADEGVGIGFDGIDPSAMVRGFFLTTEPWDAVVGWYTSSLEPRGWVGRRIKADDWWCWQRPAEPGVRIDVSDGGVYRELPGWPVPKELLGVRQFQVLFRASSRPGVIPGESETFHA